MFGKICYIFFFAESLELIQSEQPTQCPERPQRAEPGQVAAATGQQPREAEDANSGSARGRGDWGRG